MISLCFFQQLTPLECFIRTKTDHFSSLNHKWLNTKRYHILSVIASGWKAAWNPTPNSNLCDDFRRLGCLCSCAAVCRDYLGLTCYVCQIITRPKKKKSWKVWNIWIHWVLKQTQDTISADHYNLGYVSEAGLKLDVVLHVAIRLSPLNETMKPSVTKLTAHFL